MKFSKKMCFSSLVIAGLAIAGAAGAIALTHNSDAFFTKATNNDPSFSISANEFANGDGYVEKWGVKFNYTGATVAGGLVTLNQMYTNYAEGSYSGSTKSESDTRGDGFVSLSFTDYSLGEGVGEVVYVFDSSHGHLTGLGLSASVDLTNNGTISGQNRTGFEIVSNGRMITFSKLTIAYSCSNVSPEIRLKKESTSVGTGDNAEVQAETFDVFGSDTVTYAWSSDDTSVATASGSGLTGTIHGVAAGTANITVTMTVNGTDYTDSLVVTVTETAATVKDLEILKTSHIDGAGIFCRFNPSSQDVTAANLDSFGLDKISLNFASETNNKINHYTLQDRFDDSYTAYVVCDSAVGLNGQFNIVCDFKDTTNNIIYRATCYFNNGALEKDVNLTVGNENLLIGDNTTITAVKGSYLEGEPSFSFVSSDTNVVTVVANGNTATINAVGVGNATVTVTMTLGGKNYVTEQSFSVTSSVTNIPLTITKATWGGSGCQFFTDMSFTSECSSQLSDYVVTVTVDGASFSYSGLGACLQGEAVYLTFNAAPGQTDVYTVNCSLQYASTIYSFSVSFIGTTMQ
jgi:uncharacterized protein YjdB